MTIVQDIYLFTSYFTNINHSSNISLFICFCKLNNHKHPKYNLEIKEANPGYTTISAIDFNQLKHNQSITVSVQNVYLLAL